MNCLIGFNSNWFHHIVSTVYSEWIPILWPPHRMLSGPIDPTNIKRYADMKNTTDKRKRHKFTETYLYIYITKEGKLTAGSAVLMEYAHNRG